jgi:hypothetical protein
MDGAGVMHKTMFTTITTKRRTLLAISALCGVPLFSALVSAASNAEDERATYFFLLRRAYQAARWVGAFRFINVCAQCRTSNLVITNVIAEPHSRVMRLRPDDTKVIIDILFNPRSYIFGAFKAMPFFADYALVFNDIDPTAIFLLSSSYQGGRLVLNMPVSARASIVNLDPTFPIIIDRVRRTLL